MSETERPVVVAACLRLIAKLEAIKARHPDDFGGSEAQLLEGLKAIKETLEAVEKHMTKKQKDRWIKCLSEASGPLQELVELSGDAEAEYNNMSEKRQESPAGELLSRLANPNPDFQSMVDELDSIASEIEDSIEQ